MSDTQDYTATAQALGLDQEQDEPTPSTYWAHLDGDDLAVAIIDKFDRFREWQHANGLSQGWKLKLHYYHNEYRANPDVPHLSIMSQWGAAGEYSFISINQLRSLLKTVMASVISNPPSYACKSTNADASALEFAALYQGVLDYYTRELRINDKISKAVEKGLVVDSGYALIEWDPFAIDGSQPADAGIWKGSPSVRILNPWDVCYDVCKSSWQDLDWVVCRDFVDREKCKSQFPELADDIESCRSRAEVMQANTIHEPNRYDLISYPEMSNDIQVYKLFHRAQPWMPQGQFVMALETGKILFESPVGLLYPKLPVERFVCDEQLELLLGYSPINELLGPAEAVNGLVSAITTNAANYANQYVAVQTGTDINPRTLGDGQKILEYPPGANPPQGLNLTAIPATLFEHLKDLMGYMQQVPGVSNASRGQAPGANSTGSAMLFLASQSSQNQGSMSQHYNDFAAAVMTSLLHVLRVFARTEKTVSIMGKTVASKTIVMADALKDFDEVTVEMTNPVLNTPQGRLGFAQQMMQFGNATPQDALQVATSGNLGPATDPAREALYELQLENEWLLDGDQVLVNALDNHEQHIAMHTRLFATPWLRKPDLAQKLAIQNAPQIMQGIMAHIQEHMTHLGMGQAQQAMTTGGQQPGQGGPPPSPALGHPPPPQPSPAAPVNAPAQAGANGAGTQLPSQPNPPQMPGGR